MRHSAKTRSRYVALVAVTAISPIATIARAQSIKPIVDALGHPPAALAAALEAGAWLPLSPDEWGNPRYSGRLYGNQLRLTAHVVDGQLLQIEFSEATIPDSRAMRDSLDAEYSAHAGSFSPLVWTVPRTATRIDTIEMRSQVRAFVPGAAARVTASNLMRSGLDWGCVQRRAGGLKLPANEQAYHRALLDLASSLVARGAPPQMLRRASCGTAQLNDFREAVVLAYGRPESVTESQNALGQLEVWYYDGMRTVVTFTNGRVTDITRHR